MVRVSEKEQPRQVVQTNATRPMQRARWLLLLAALAFYWLTLDNGLQPEELRGGDLITHQYAQVQARPSNAPGYPLYTMGGWLWFHALRPLVTVWGNGALWGDGLPNPIPILSSYSTLWALVALWLLYSILCRLTRSPYTPAGDWRLAVLLTGYYGVTYFFWYYATTTEQYSSAIAQTLAILYLYLLWQEAQAAEKRALVLYSHLGSRANRILAALALLCGISLAHMLTVAFIVPPLVLVILWQAPRLLRAGRVIFVMVGAAALPLVSYLYVYLRGAANPAWWGAGTWTSPEAWFWAFVSTAQGREELGWGWQPWCTPFANGFPALIGHELTWPLVILGLMGLALLGRRLALLCYGTLLIYLAFAWAYRCGNWFQVILPAYPLLIIGAALLFHRLFSQIVQRVGASSRWHALGRGGIEVLLLLTIAMRITTLWPTTNSHNRAADSALDHAAQLLATPLPSEQRLFATVDDALALQYLTTIWQLRPDLGIVSSPQASAWIADGKSVYSSWEAAPTLLAELSPDLAVTKVAVDPNWVRVALTSPAEGGTTPAAVDVTVDVTVGERNVELIGAQLLDQEVLPGLWLHGYRATQPPRSPLAAYRREIVQGADGLDLLLIWQLTNSEWPADLAISVRLTHDGTMLDGLQLDRTAPATGLSNVEEGLISDPYHFSYEDERAPEVDGAVVILYRTTASGFENVAVLPLAWQ